jgi:hypothetical protein
LKRLFAIFFDLMLGNELACAQLEKELATQPRTGIESDSHDTFEGGLEGAWFEFVGMAVALNTALARGAPT